jgi:hypothetical protein
MFRAGLGDRFHISVAMETPLTSLTLEGYYLREMPSSGLLRRVAVVITDVCEELSDTIIRVIRILELRTTLSVTSNGLALRRNTK